ncbi:MAG: TetR/AcrR family transcriptional regulator [Deltaproteobacteria bacterium]|nr:MAG: TetR/AcrR family transcriptional regulator [Deltaproteobacteria bacterium]
MPRIVDHEARREELLDRAFELFALRGYAAVSMRDLARSIDATTGTLYHYFPSKDDIFEALVRRRAEADLREATKDLSPDATPAEQLAAFTTFYVNRLDGLQDTLRVVLDFKQQRPPGEAHEFIVAAFEAYRAPLRAVFGEELGTVGLSLLIGLLTQRMLDPDAVDVVRHFRAMAEWLPQDAPPLPSAPVEKTQNEGKEEVD